MLNIDIIKIPMQTRWEATRPWGMVKEPTREGSQEITPVTDKARSSNICMLLRHLEAESYKWLPLEWG